MQWIINDEVAHMTVNDFLRKKQSFSRRILTAIKYDGGSIVVNGAEVRTTYKLQVADCLRVTFPKESRGPMLTPEKGPLNIVYEDDYVLVINKPAHLATIPSAIHPRNTLANRIIHYYNENDIHSTIHVVTRLDRDTSGLVLIAKNRYIHSLLSQHMHKKSIRRKYYALVEGNLEQQAGEINARIDRKQGSIIEREVTDRGKAALTVYRVLKEGPRYSLLDVELNTGRTHQIRVHFSHINHPLLGDDLYGGTTQVMMRQALHCYYLSFNHPTTNEYIELTTSLPEEMQEIIL